MSALWHHTFIAPEVLGWALGVICKQHAQRYHVLVNKTHNSNINNSDTNSNSFPLFRPLS